MPRVKPPTKPSGVNASPLGIYLREVAKTSTQAFARAFGCSLKTCQEWVYGTSVPHIAAAWEIERLTKGAVPIEAWLALAQCKTMLSRWRAQQSPEAQSVRPPPAGGFAAPPGKNITAGRNAAEGEPDDEPGEEDLGEA